MTSRPRPIAIVGLPRSGTTWTMRVLGTSPGALNVGEADNEDKYPAAIHAKRRLGRYPVLVPGDENRAYHRLWEWIFDGGFEDARSRKARQILGPGYEDRIFEGRLDFITWAAGTLARDPRPSGGPGGSGFRHRVIAKSIHAQLALEWLTSAFEVDALVLLRHPANVLASWTEVKLKDSRNSTLETRPEIRSRYVERWGVPLPGSDPIEQMSWRIGLMLAALEEQISRNPSWHVRTHEALCSDPPAEFRKLFDDLGLEWTSETDAFLQSHDTPGEGFFVKRIASELSDSWQRRLDDDQLATLRRVLAWFPISTWSERDFERPKGSDA
jgi:hypothetical protein